MNSRLYPYSISKVLTFKSLSIVLLLTLFIILPYSIYTLVKGYTTIVSSTHNMSELEYKLIILNARSLVSLYIIGVMLSIILGVMVISLWMALDEIVKNLSDYNEYMELSRRINKFTLLVIVSVLMMFFLLLLFLKVI